MEFTDVVMMTYKQLISEAHELRHLRSNEHDNVKWRVITDRLIVVQDEIRSRDYRRLHDAEIKTAKAVANWNDLVEFVKQRSN